MTKRHVTLLLCGAVLLGACAEEPPPRTAEEFIENPMLLEAAVIRCGQNRAQSRYDAECVNARTAVQRIEAKEEAARKAELEEVSERKRRALRRTQAAAAEARRRAAEREKQRREEESLAQFGELPAEGAAAASDESASGNLPGAEILPPPQDSGGNYSGDSAVPASDGGNAPEMDAAPETEPATDLDSIRDELRRRNEQGGG